jgi:hypothetical protein
MYFARKSSLSVIAMLAVVLAFSASSFAKTNKSNFPNIKISNFGQMDERFYRGARPSANDLRSLAAIGIHTILDLTDNSRQ